MKRVFVFLVALAASSAFGSESWLGIYLMGQKIGYSSYVETAQTVGGKSGMRSVSTMVMDAALLGTELKMRITGITTMDAARRPVTIKFLSESQGRVQNVSATVGATSIDVEIDAQGTKSKKSIAIPKDGVLSDDASSFYANGTFPMGGTKLVFYVLDPSTVSLVRNVATFKGKATAKVRGKDVSAMLMEVVEPRATSKIYLSAKGDVIKIEGPMGMEMYPESKEVAVNLSGRGSAKPIDLASASSISVDKPIPDPRTLASVKLRVTGKSLAALPSGQNQTVTHEGEDWIVETNPAKLSAVANPTIAQAAAGQSKWTQPGLYLPSDTPTFTKLAKSIVKGTPKVIDAALAIRQYVHSLMTPNAGIGVLRDASEVLKTKEGVCRDYAILTGTLMRAAGIPARVVSGLTYFAGKFYYHAWVEIWNSAQWIGIDSTEDWDQITPTHIKLAEGHVEEAFVFTLLDGVKIDVIETKPNG